MPLVEEKPNGFPTKAFGNDKRVSPNAVCKFRVIASEAKQSLIEKRLLRRLAAPRNDTDNKNSHMTLSPNFIPLCDYSCDEYTTAAGQSRSRSMGSSPRKPR